MKIVTETVRVAYKYHFFGWHVTISNCPVKFAQKGLHNPTANHRMLLHDRLAMARCKCERCGRDLSIFARMLHLLPAGHPDRNTIDNIRCVCNSCYKAVMKGAPLELPLQPEEAQKGGEA